jgi:hypothetical protein
MQSATSRRSVRTLPRGPPFPQSVSACTRKVCGISTLRIAERQARLFEPRLFPTGGRLVPLRRSGLRSANGSIPLLSTTLTREEPRTRPTALSDRFTL